MFWLAILAVVGCAICNGVAAILQKLGADKQDRVSSLDARLLVRLTHSSPYVVGLVLDLLGWTLTVFAVRFIPLFLAQAVIAANVAVTAFLDHVVLKHRLSHTVWWSLALLFVGLGLLAVSATKQTAFTVHGSLELGIVLGPVFCLILGMAFVRWHNKISAFVLALVSGMAFGGTSVVGRVLPLQAGWVHALASPLLWALIAYGFTGVLLFTIVLQRSLATTVNAAMTATQTLLPALIGLVFLHDIVRGDSWITIVTGLVFTLVGVVGIALEDETPKKKHQPSAATPTRSVAGL